VTKKISRRDSLLLAGGAALGYGLGISRLSSDKAEDIKKVSQNKQVIFLHAPKNAGVTLLNIVQANVPCDQLGLIYPPGQWSDAISLITEDEANNYDYIFGHFDFQIDQILTRTREYVTVFRHPIARTLDMYHHFRSFALSENAKNTHLYNIKDPHIESGIDISFLEFVQKFPQAQNEMTRRISGMRCFVDDTTCTSGMLSKAKENLEKHFTLIGILEEFDIFLQMLEAKFSWQVDRTIHSNRSKHLRKPSSLSKEEKDAVIAANQLDLEFYAFAQKLSQSHRQNYLG